MCGLFGWVRAEKSRPHLEKAWALSMSLAHLNDDRGGDSWGFAGGGLSQPIKGLKEAFGMSEKKARTMSSRPWLIGHTRKATTGEVTKSNSHPFVIGDVTGAHNGMVTNHHILNSIYGRSCEVDSMHIFHHIDDGVDSFSDIEGYGAITFSCYHTPEEVYLGTFNNGELAVADVPDFGLVWSSSLAHLKAGLKTAGLKRARHLPLKDGRAYVATPRGMQSCGLVLDFDDPWYRWRKSDLMSQTGMSEMELLQKELEDMWEDEELEMYANTER